MAARAEAQVITPYTRRVRGVWIVLALSMTLFCGVCATSGAGIYGYLTSVTRNERAKLELAHGTQLTVIRHRGVDRVAVQTSAGLNEGDEVSTGDETEANIDLFDGSTALLSFNTKVTLDNLRTSRFIGNRKDITLHLESGTILFSTADIDGFSSAGYKITTPQAEIEVERNSTVRVHITDGEGGPSTEAAVTAGAATILSGGAKVDIQPGYMSSVMLNTEPTEPHPAEQELIRNGDFTKPPTSRAEDASEGGLGTAAWMPVLDRSGENAIISSTVAVMTEYLGKQAVHSAQIDRNAPGDRYARVGLRQDVNVSTSYFHQIDLQATIKIVAQTEPVGGPQADVYPLTIKVLYNDSNGKPQEWKHSFYYCSTGPGTCTTENASDVPLGTYTTTQKLALKHLGDTAAASSGKQATPGQAPAAKSDTEASRDIAVINAIEIFGIGDRFQSWITDVSLTAR